ncbi:MAG: 2,3-bisphosphoglycerate-independent phosphoglycerate mutase [Deltaproteobacteria bacterium]|nr:2,3-bisphosphoglycerate-independent phosphoglycerate mutase [Deltaproteobacteria bacterium]
MNKPTLLMILDGWGYREEAQDNAIKLAKTPHYDALLQDYPHALVDASGPAVGLPQGIMGNSEVGHLNIGAGRIAPVGLTRIYQAIEDKSFFTNPALLKAVNAARNHHSTLHLMGLLSDGAVHSHQDHLYALLQLAKAQGLNRVAIHVFTDGRDTDPQSGLGYVQALEEKIKEIGVGKIATLMGRYYAMDRDQRWERTQKAYDALVLGQGEVFDSAKEALQDSYAKGVTDEFVKPIVLKGGENIKDLDSIIFFNFRSDRARQLTQALAFRDFDAFKKNFVPLSCFTCMAEYDKKFKLPVAFPALEIKNTLGELVSREGLHQLRLAETEKYAHVTFFFNGGEEKIFPGEERILVPSPREVPTYDQKPEMSAPEITQKLLEALDSQKFDLIVLNFANSDMVGHTGNLEAAIAAIECLDKQIGKIVKSIQAKQGFMILTADHGNSDQMKDAHGRIHTAHTTNLVPFILVSPQGKNLKLRKQGTLADVAPTILELLGIQKPKEMTGQSMIVHS